MIKVQVRKVGAALVGAALAHGMIACAISDPSANQAVSSYQEEVASASAAYSVPTPGEATLLLDYYYSPQDGTSSKRFLVSTTNTDEFVRSGEKLTLQIPGYVIVGLVQSDYNSITNDNLPNVTGEVKIRFLKGNEPVGNATVKIASYKANATYGWTDAVTESFVVPTGVSAMTFEFTATSPDTNKTGTESIGATLVFGGELPHKHAFFDVDDAGALRNRIVERGGPVAGAELVVAYSENRAQKLVGNGALDARIGRMHSNCERFGPCDVDLYGTIVQEVAVGYAFDNAGWQEQKLTQSAMSYVKYGRSQETRLFVPASAKKLNMYFHVKTYLEVHYPQGNIFEKKYNEGDRVLKAEIFDNPNGSGSNFDFGTETSEGLGPNFKRTVLLVKGETAPGQDMFIRGGIDHSASKTVLGIDCANNDGTPNYKCAIPLVHRNLRNETTRPWKLGDGLLDWYGRETTQTVFSHGMLAEGTAADWTTNVWPTSYGPSKSVAKDGYGLEPLNKYGPHYWMLDVDMDCSRAFRAPDGTRWFEVKTFISNGPGWEPDVRQAGAPYASINHFAKCGQLNVFERGTSTATFATLPTTP